MLRNVAEKYVETSHSFHCDIDFIPSFLARNKLITKYRSLLAESKRRRILFVMPAFEQTTPYNTEQNLDTLPLEPTEAKEWIKNGGLRPFHYKCTLCQSPSNLTMWQNAKSPYKIDPRREKNYKYEPYVVLPTRLLDWNEAFTGYGRDKTLYFYELFELLEFETIVLPDVFIIHRDHKKSIDARKFRKVANKDYRVERRDFYLQQKQDLIFRYYVNGQLPASIRTPLLEGMVDFEDAPKNFIAYRVTFLFIILIVARSFMRKRK